MTDHHEPMPTDSTLAETFAGMWDRIDNEPTMRTRQYKAPRMRKLSPARKPPFKAWRKAHLAKQEAV